MVLSTLRPSRSAHIEAPLPRCATMTRPARSPARPRAGARRYIRRTGRESRSVDAFGIELLRNGVVIGDRDVAAVEGRIETGDLRQLGIDRQQAGSAPDCSAGEAAPAGLIASRSLKHVRIDQHRLRIVRAAMDDAMADRRQLESVQRLAATSRTTRDSGGQIGHRVRQHSSGRQGRRRH